MNAGLLEQEVKRPGVSFFKKNTPDLLISCEALGRD
jgi:hypothetical protein